MHTMNRDATTITAAHDKTTGARMTPRMTGHLVHPRGLESIVTTCAFRHGRVQRHAKKEAAIVATTTVRVISTTIAAIEDRKSDSIDHFAKTTAVTSAKLHAISRLPGGSRLLDKA